MEQPGRVLVVGVVGAPCRVCRAVRRSRARGGSRWRATGRRRPLGTPRSTQPAAVRPVCAGRTPRSAAAPGRVRPRGLHDPAPGSASMRHAGAL